MQKKEAGIQDQTLRKSKILIVLPNWILKHLLHGDKLEGAILEKGTEDTFQSQLKTILRGMGSRSVLGTACCIELQSSGHVDVGLIFLSLRMWVTAVQPR
jgi:hypothetical protein